MERLEQKFCLVLDEFYWRKLNVTSLTVAELGAPFVGGDAVYDAASGTIFNIQERGFRPKRGGMSGILRSELSREALLLIKGKAKIPLTGRFLVPPDSDIFAWRLSVKIIHFTQIVSLRQGSMMSWG